MGREAQPRGKVHAMTPREKPYDSYEKNWDSLSVSTFCLVLIHAKHITVTNQWQRLNQLLSRLHMPLAFSHVLDS